MDEKQRIKRLRDSAASFDISHPDDPSEIVELVAVGDVALYAVKRGGVYQVELADTIDPNRTNAAIPNTFRRVLPAGADDEYVNNLFLGGKRLLNDAYLGKGIDCTRGVQLCLDATRHVLRMRELAEQLETSVTAASGQAEAVERRTLRLPTTPNLEHQVEAYFRHAHDVLKLALEVLKLFHGQPAIGGRGKDQKRKPKNERVSNRFQAAADFALAALGESAPLSRFLTEALPFVLFVWNTRNAIEHPRADEKVVISDFTIDPTANAIQAPTIEVMSSSHPQPAVSVTEITKLYVAEVATFFEELLAVLCDHRVQTSKSGLKTRVVALSKEQQGDRKRGRFAYEVQLPGGRSALGL
jgi:hypothetical protein